MTDTLLAWFDAETTGLDPSKDPLLEIAVLITDLNLEIPDDRTIDEGYPVFQRVLFVPDVDHFREKADPYVQEMHDKNGLWDEVTHAMQGSMGVDAELDQWLHGVVMDRELRIAGNSVHFDLGFLRAQMPKTAAHFSHRIVDMTSNQFFVERVAGIPVHDIGKPEGADAAHRAMADVLWSLEQAQNLQEMLRDLA